MTLYEGVWIGGRVDGLIVLLFSVSVTRCIRIWFPVVTRHQVYDGVTKCLVSQTAT